MKGSLIRHVNGATWMIGLLRIIKSQYLMLKKLLQKINPSRQVPRKLSLLSLMQAKQYSLKLRLLILRIHKLSLQTKLLYRKMPQLKLQLELHFQTIKCLLLLR